MSRLRTAIILACAAAAIGAADPGYAADPALYQAARREGEVVWYTALIVNQAVRPLIEVFNKKYPGIEVHYGRADSGPTAIKIMSEARAGKVQSDVFDGIDATPPLVQAGLVEPFVPSDADKYPAALEDPSGYWNALVVISSPRRSIPIWCPRRSGRASQPICSTRDGEAGSPGARHPPLAPPFTWARCWPPWGSAAAWISCAR